MQENSTLEVWLISDNNYKINSFYVSGITLFKCIYFTETVEEVITDEHGDFINNISIFQLIIIAMIYIMLHWDYFF